MIAGMIKEFSIRQCFVLTRFFLGMTAKILLELSCVFVPMVSENWVPLMNVKISMNVLQITTNMKVEKVSFFCLYILCEKGNR